MGQHKDAREWGTTSATPGVIHIPAGDGPTVWLSGDVYTVKLGKQESGNMLTLLEATVPPGAGPPVHVHADADEALYLLHGELEIFADDQLYTVSSGDFVFIKRGTRHRFRNIGTHVAHQLLLFTPAGIEGFFLEAGQRAEAGTALPTPDPEDNVRVAAIGERYHLFQASGPGD